ncbi:uncharacterized protein [Prorops nasuta]|uniref:uncharacterized protein n=1 Tax=Prorops nasuta TaxID=863751 RepID=UPI0034CF1FD4
MARYAEAAYYDFALKLTQEAAQILRNSITGLKDVDEKRGNWDLVTQYDRKIEDIIIRKLRQEYPSHKFIAEESSGKELPELTDDPTWIIDPIDGTTNFVHGFPHTCVVVGLAIRKEMVIGIVYNPVLEQLFTARKGRGAFLNGKSIHVSNIQDLSKALVCMETGFMRIDSLRELTIERVQAVVEQVQGIRTLGVAALSLCYVALGIVEAYYVEGPGVSTWDIAAASLIISEAGGVVIDRVTGNPIDIMKARAIAGCNMKIAQDIFQIIRKADERVQLKKKPNYFGLCPSYKTMESYNIDEYFDFVKELIMNAGMVIKDGINKEKIIDCKGIDWDLVTDYDHKVEDAIIKNLSQKYPSHKFIGEEAAAKAGVMPILTDDPTWIIDPIDGTTNFVHRFPHTCISVALLIRKKIEIGIVYNPIINQFFSAKKGFGAFLNGKLIKTSTVEDLSQALVAMEPWIAKDKEYLCSIYSRMHAIIQNTHGVRTLGTAALSLCYVAMGAVEAYHVESIDSWDVAAGTLIIEEAGGIVIDTNGGSLDIMEPRVIAACNNQIGEKIVKLFQNIDSSQFSKSIIKVTS